MTSTTSLSPASIQLVRDSWSQVLPIQTQAAGLFYNRLFELDPALKPLFKGDMAEQGRKLMGMVNVAVGSLDRLDGILKPVQDMGRRHAGYGVKDEHYATVGEALIWTLEQGLGEAFTPETRAAWVRVYTLLADAMREAAPVAA